MNRILRTMKSSHAAYMPFVSLVRDVFFVCSKEDVANVETMLHKKGLSAEDIASMRKKNWLLFIKYCRRRVPEPKELARRLNRLELVYIDVKDPATGEVLLRPLTIKEADNVKKHIRLGCFSDVAGIDLYFDVGINKDDLTIYK
jgi:hypothetical protein